MPLLEFDTIPFIVFIPVMEVRLNGGSVACVSGVAALMGINDAAVIVGVNILGLEGTIIAAAGGAAAGPQHR